MSCHKKIGLNIKSGSLILTSSRTVEDRIAVLIFRGADIRRKTVNLLLLFLLFLIFTPLLLLVFILPHVPAFFLTLSLGFWCSKTVHNFCDCRPIHTISYSFAAWYPNRGFYVETKINKNILSRTILRSKTTCCWIPHR